MSGELTLEPFDSSHRDAYLALLGKAWGGDALGGETFDWWFDRNPAGSLRSVAMREDEVVGVAGHSRCRLMIDGRESVGQFSVHAVTAPEARGLGIFRALELRHEEQGREADSACVLAFASAPTRPLFLEPLGWTQIDRRRVWARPLPIGRGRFSAPERFDLRHDEAHSGQTHHLHNHVVRDSRYLNWRYVESPREYRLLEADRGGFAVVGFTRKHGLRLALVMELVAGPEDTGALLRGALAAARGSAALLAVPSPSLTRARLLRHGFLPTTYRLDFMGKGLAKPLDARSEAWTVSFGDTDFF